MCAIFRRSRPPKRDAPPEPPITTADVDAHFRQLVADLPPELQTEAIVRMLEIVARVHQAHALEPPSWLVELRGRDGRR